MSVRAKFILNKIEASIFTKSEQVTVVSEDGKIGR
jgi:hypothetical protein